MENIPNVLEIFLAALRDENGNEMNVRDPRSLIQLSNQLIWMLGPGLCKEIVPRAQ